MDNQIEQAKVALARRPTMSMAVNHAHLYQQMCDQMDQGLAAISAMEVEIAALKAQVEAADALAKVAEEVWCSSDLANGHVHDKLAWATEVYNATRTNEAPE